MKTEQKNNRTTSMESDKLKSELLIEGRRVTLNFLAPGHPSGLETAKKLLLQSALTNMAPCTGAK